MGSLRVQGGQSPHFPHWEGPEWSLWSPQGSGTEDGFCGAGGSGGALQPLSLALGSPAEAGPD